MGDGRAPSGFLDHRVFLGDAEDLVDGIYVHCVF